MKLKSQACKNKMKPKSQAFKFRFILVLACSKNYKAP